LAQNIAAPLMRSPHRSLIASPKEFHCRFDTLFNGTTAITAPPPKQKLQEFFPGNSIELSRYCFSSSDKEFGDVSSVYSTSA